MLQEHAEEYLGAIYRLRTTPDTPVPLAQLTEYFGYSPVSVHEMVKKLSAQEWVAYHPYQGVTLTPTGQKVALALLRRHRLWERFLTDTLHVPWEEAHELAGALEHAVTEEVTERLATFLGDPASCPHGAPIPPSMPSIEERCLADLPTGARGRITRVSQESAALLHELGTRGILPGALFVIAAQNHDEIVIELAKHAAHLPLKSAQMVRVELF